jgi:hypothetical protein
MNDVLHFIWRTLPSWIGLIAGFVFTHLQQAVWLATLAYTLVNLATVIRDKWWPRKQADGEGRK